MTESLKHLLSKMTLEEKAAICTGASSWKTIGIPRLGIPEITVSDGPHGVRRIPDGIDSLGSKSIPATCFPTASCLASTWNTDLIYELGQALGKECIALNVDILLGPGVNLKRSPLCGRNFEYYSEDPFLAGELGASFINGVQSMGVGTSLKHFAVNNQEFQRFFISAEVDERTLHEIYLSAFETCVKKSKPWSVMSAYNRINGTYASEHYELLVHILKEEWGFEGFVVSDWGAVHDRVASLRSGLDLEMPGPKDYRVQSVIQAVKSGELDEAILNQSVERLLQIIFKSKETFKGNIKLDIDKHHKLARNVASEGIVLLKNNGILPIKTASSIAVIGRTAKEPHFQGGGSSHVHPTRVDVPFVELQKLAKESELIYVEGYPAGPEHRQDLINEAVAVAKNAEIALIYIGLPSFIESEGYDRRDLELTIQQTAMIKAVTEIQPNTIVILNNGSVVSMHDWIDGTAAVLEGWLIGQAGGGAIADVLFGVVNPSGKLSETFPKQLTDTPAYINFPGGAGSVNYGEGIFIGYRYYDMKAIPVQFPFGYGLSYTTFAYCNPVVSATRFRDSEGLKVSIDIDNTGDVAGKEIVQVYIKDMKSKLIRPPKELKGFAKISLEPGEQKTIDFKFDQRAFSYYHPSYRQWITEDGEFEILIGASAEDIKYTIKVEMESTMELPCLLNQESTIKEWLEDPKGSQVFQPIFKILKDNMGQTFGADEEESQIGVDSMGFLMEMPLLSILGFQENRLPMSANKIIELLLSQIEDIK